MAKRKIKNTYNTEDEAMPGNSNASKVAPIRETTIQIEEEGANIEEPKVVRKTIKGRAIRKKRSLIQSFFSEDTKNVGQYVLFEVLIPAAKSMIQEMVTQGIEMFLFGGEGSGRSRSRNREETKVSYNRMYKGREDPRESRRSSRRDRFELEEIFFRRGDEASKVLEDLCDQLEKYDQVSVADYFDLAGIDDTNNWATRKWGWDDLTRARCTHTRQGWAIILPDPIELD